MTKRHKTWYIEPISVIYRFVKENLGIERWNVYAFGVENLVPFDRKTISSRARNARAIFNGKICHNQVRMEQFNKVRLRCFVWKWKRSKFLENDGLYWDRRNKTTLSINIWRNFVKHVERICKATKIFMGIRGTQLKRLLSIVKLCGYSRLISKRFSRGWRKSRYSNIKRNSEQ